MIRRNMLARVIAVAVAMGASLPLAVAQERYAPGYEDDSDDVRRVGRRGREDVEEGRSEEAHARNEEREAQREAERMQREQEQQQRQMERESAQQQREQERAQAEQYRAAEQQQRGMEQEQRQAEQQQREAMRAMEQERRQGEQQQREMQRAAEQAQRQAEQEQRAYEREQRQAEQARQPRELELQRGEGERGGGRRTHWTEEQRAEQLRVDREYAEQQQRQQAAPARGAESDAREEIRRVEQERYQVERGGDRQRYDESRDGRDGRDGRGSRDRGVTEERSYGRDTRHDGGWGDPRQRWNANPREIPQPREGARLSDRERQSLYNQQRQHADRYGRDWSRRVDDYQRRVDSLQGRRNEQYRYQQRYWQRHRDYRSRWLSFGWNYQRDPFFYSAPTHRYYRGGRWYSANRYAIDVLQQAIRIGYEEGYYAGEADRYDGWRAGWRDNYAYQDASLGYQGWYVSEEEYRYYFREGFRRGYEDAFNRRWRYGRRYQSGFSILPNELDVILRFELGR